MSDFTQLFLYIPGVIIFLVGSGSARSWLATRRLGSCVDATVISCEHIVKKDRQGREVYNYYNTVVEYFKPERNIRARETVKSPSEYGEGQQVKLFLRGNKDDSILLQTEDESLFNPWVTMIEGALLILLAFFQTQGNEIYAMISLALVMLIAGIVMLLNYFTLKKRNLQELDATITDVYTRQISKESKILKGNKYTYYPIVEYMLNGKKNIRRCNVNSGNKNDFKDGSSLKLYYDADKRIVVEQNAKKSRLIWGIILCLLGILSGISIISVL